MDWYVETLEKLQKELDEEEEFTERYYKLMDAINKLQEMKIKEERVVNESVEEYNRSTQNRKSERKRFIIDILKLVTSIGGSIGMLILMMAFEMGRGQILQQKFLAFIPKPKL